MKLSFSFRICGEEQSYEQRFIECWLLTLRNPIEIIGLIYRGKFGE